MKKLVFKMVSTLLACALLFTGGCAARTAEVKAQPAAADPFSVRVALTNEKEDNIQVQTAVPEFSGFSAAAELNAKISKVSQDGIAELKEATKDLQIGDTAGAGSLYYASFFDYTRNNDVLSVWVTSENYSGGAHGTHGITAFTVNTKTGEFYTALSSLFSDAQTGEQKITDQILTKINAQPDAFFPEAVQTVKDKKGDYLYYLNGGTLVVYFELYELVPYVGGIPTFEFPVKDLALKPTLSDVKPLGNTRLNGTDVAFENPVVSDENGSYLPLEETAALLGRTVTNTDGKYAVDGQTVEVKTIDGKIYAPITFFSGTLGDFVIYDGTVLRFFPKTRDLLDAPEQGSEPVSSKLTTMGQY